MVTLHQVTTIVLLETAQLLLFSVVGEDACPSTVFIGASRPHSMVCCPPARALSACVPPRFQRASYFHHPVVWSELTLVSSCCRLQAHFLVDVRCFTSSESLFLT